MQDGTETLKATAKRLAKEVSTFLLSPVSSVAENKPFLSYVDFLWVGLSMDDALTSFGIMPPVSEFLNEQGDLEPIRLEQALYEKIFAKAREASPEEFRRDVHRIRELITTRRGLRQLHIDLVRTVIPAARAGRERKISREQLPELAKLSDTLLPAIRTFLEVQKHAPQANTSRTVEYLRNGIPGEVFQYLIQHCPRLDSEYRRLPKVGTTASRARRLADALAGDKWGLSGSYAVKMSKLARGKKSRRRNA